MKAQLSNKEITAELSTNEVVTEEKVPYEAPEVTVMGKVEHLTALLGQGSPDLLGGHSLL
jgi:hypothetical protein